MIQQIKKSQVHMWKEGIMFDSVQKVIVSIFCLMK